MKTVRPFTMIDWIVSAVWMVFSALVFAVGPEDRASAWAMAAILIIIFAVYWIRRRSRG